MSSTIAPVRPASLNAHWFDGLSTRARPAEVQLTASTAGPKLGLRALDNGQVLELTHAQVGWPERWSADRAPARLVVDLGPHGSLQIEDPAAWQSMLTQAGRRPPLAERMQTQVQILLVMLLLAGVGIWAFYRWGTPWAATQLARFVPLTWEQTLTEQAMQQLDTDYLKPSKLAPGRQAELRTGFARLAALAGTDLQRYPGYTPPLKLEFRSGMPANAFALPGGTIVMTDALVEQAEQTGGTGDTALLGVLAHEIGHVAYRHSTRMLVEQGVLNVGLGLALGDVSSIVSFSSSLLTGLAYRRNHETEADCYAVAMMGKAGLPTKPMTDLLLAIERRGSDQSKGKETGASAAPASETPPESSRFDWLSTHPDTGARAKQLCPAG